jgi:hypothetical protein
MSTNFCDFCQFSAKKFGVFPKIQCYDQNFEQFCFVLSQKRQFFRQKIRRNYLKNHNIGPWFITHTNVCIHTAHPKVWNFLFIKLGKKEIWYGGLTLQGPGHRLCFGSLGWPPGVRGGLNRVWRASTAATAYNFCFMKFLSSITVEAVDFLQTLFRAPYPWFRVSLGLGGQDLTKLTTGKEYYTICILKVA